MEQKLQAVLIGWGLYGAYVDWDKSKREAETAYAQKVAQLLLLLIENKNL